MGGFALIVGAGPGDRYRSLGEGVLRRALARRGADDWAAVSTPEATAMAVRHRWERDPDIGGSTAVATSGGVLAVADASLYYRDALMARLRSAGVRLEGSAPVHLILAAYRAWGTECVQHLEGDWAFAIWDPATRALFAARDVFGARPLYFAEAAGGLVVASAVAPLLRLVPGEPQLSLNGLVRVVAFRDGDGSRTVWKGIHELPAGCALSGDPDRLFWRRWRHRVLRPDPEAARLPFDDAASRFAELLEDASAERVPASGAAVAMSGGLDSTSITASIEARRARDGRGLPVKVVTLAYPPGDPGNEDAFVEEVLRFWNLQARRVDTRAIPVVRDPWGSAAGRDQPGGHPFEHQNRALARAAREEGVRVLLNGAGGDNLLIPRPEFLADLAARGRWVSLVKAMRALGLGLRWPNLREYALRPLVPQWLWRVRDAATGRRGALRPFGFPTPPWLVVDRLYDTGIMDEDLVDQRSRLETWAADRGLRFRLWALAHPCFQRVAAELHEVSAGEGVDLRYPMYDPRVAEFVLARPETDLLRRGEVKVLLTRAMRGRLPDRVLAPRPRRTGMPVRYFGDGLRPAVAELVRELDGCRTLAEMGVIDRARFEEGVRRYLAGDATVDLMVLQTLQTELWLRTRVAAEQQEAWETPAVAEPALAMPRSA